MKQKELLAQSMHDLQTQLHRHQMLMQAFFQGEELEAECGPNSCRHYQKLLNLIAETICVLDETRRAFKSKAIEQLRLRLLQTLSEETHDALICK